MSTVPSRNLTWMDHARRIDKDGKVDRIVEMMNTTNEVMDDMVMIESNQTNSHLTTIRTGLPTVAWRQINKGVQASKSVTKQVVMSAGHMESLGKVDEKLVDVAQDGAGLRLSENAPHLEAISQTIASTIFYGNTEANPERFTGLSYYYSTSVVATAESGTNVIKAGGEGSDNTSLWLVVWGENTIHAFYPRGTKAGIDHQDLGKMLTRDEETPAGEYMAYVDQYKAQMGLAVRNWKFAVRICNIDVSNLATAGESSDTSANLLNYMIKAINKIPNLRAGKAAFYCNTEVKTALDIKALNKTNVFLTIQDLQNGGTVTKFLGIPIRRCDAILNTEAVVA